MILVIQLNAVNVKELDAVEAYITMKYSFFFSFSS